MKRLRVLVMYALLTTAHLHGNIIHASRSGGIGRRAAFRAQWAIARVGSTPTFGTIFSQSPSSRAFLFPRKHPFISVHAHVERCACCLPSTHVGLLVVSSRLALIEPTTSAILYERPDDPQPSRDTPVGLPVIRGVDWVAPQRLAVDVLWGASLGSVTVLLSR